MAKQKKGGMTERPKGTAELTPAGGGRPQGQKENKQKTPKWAKPGFSGKPTSDQYMNPNQNAIQYGIEQGDLGILGSANNMLGRVGDSYADPYDYQGPGQAVADPAERQRIEGEIFSEFERRDAPILAQENEDLQRWAASTGNSPDSPAYQARQEQLSQAQNDRRLSAQSQATQLGGQEYERSFNLKDRAYQTGVGDYENRRDRPLQEYAGLRGAVAGNPAQDFSFQSRLQQQQHKNNLATIRAQKGGGGGGGGRGRGITEKPKGYEVVGGIQNKGQGQEANWYDGLIGAGAAGVGQGVGSWIGSLF